MRELKARSLEKGRRGGATAAAEALARGASLILIACGCMAERPPGHNNPQTATVAHWSQQPASTQVVADDYAALWEAADEARQRFGFEPAMNDYRGGLMTTEPKTSPQWFELWHRELRTPGAIAESSLATIRRRLRLEFSRLPDGRFAVEPKVIVERLSLAERRITSAMHYRGTLGPGRQQQFGPSDQSRERPGRYWYAIGRDGELEHTLAELIAKLAQ